MHIRMLPAPGTPVRGFTFLDYVLLRALQLWGAIALLALALVPARFLPAEDAVILFAYSRNLAVHGAITYLAGGPHVEGATDFAWMLLLAGAMRCGIPPFWFCALANVICLVSLALVLLHIAHRRPTVARVLAIAGAAALFRQIFAAASGFAVLPDALLLAMLTLFVAETRATPAALAALLFCLFRPDGVVLAVPLLLILLFRSPERARAATRVGLFFVAPGLLYFLWRVHYFGELFPLPFLVKTDFHRELGFLIAGSVRASLVPLLFTAVVLTPVFLLRRRSNLWFALALIGAPTLFYWSVRLDQNVGSRFFYYLPIAAALLIAMNWDALDHRLTFRTAFLAWLLLLAAPLYRESLTFRFMQFRNVEAIAKALRALPRHGTLLTSEAGFLPYYSGWPSIDPWGLNTPEFAHRFFQPEDVLRANADLIVFHPDLGESCVPQRDWAPAYPNRSWPHMTRNLVLGAAKGHYELWLTQYGSDFYQESKHFPPGKKDRECWLLNQTSPLLPKLQGILLRHGGIKPTQAERLERER